VRHSGSKAAEPPPPKPNRSRGSAPHEQFLEQGAHNKFTPVSLLPRRRAAIHTANWAPFIPTIKDRQWRYAEGVARGVMAIVNMRSSIGIWVRIGEQLQAGSRMRPSEAKTTALKNMYRLDAHPACAQEALSGLRRRCSTSFGFHGWEKFRYQVEVLSRERKPGGEGHWERADHWRSTMP
jgi:hypothetical protein